MEEISTALRTADRDRILGELDAVQDKVLSVAHRLSLGEVTAAFADTLLDASSELQNAMARIAVIHTLEELEGGDVSGNS